MGIRVPAQIVSSGVAFIAMVSATSIAATLTRPHAVAAQSGIIVRPAGASTVDWPQLGMNAGHSWFNQSEKTLNAGNVGELEQAWSTSTGTNNMAGNVVLAGGILYAPSANGNLFALNASTGATLWMFASGSGFTSSGSAPAVDHGLVFTLCNAPSGDQALCALNATTGALQWRYAVPGATMYAEAPPVVSDNEVFLGACGTFCGYLALSEKSGKVIWMTPETIGCAMNGGAPPVLYKKVFVAANLGDCTYNELLGLNASNGAQLWNVQLAGEVTGMAGANQRVIVVDGFTPNIGPERDEVWAFDPSNGLYDWHRTTTQQQVLNANLYPAIAYKTAYVPVLQGMTWYKLTGHRGNERWSLGGNEPSAALANDLLFSTFSGTPVAIDALGEAVFWNPSGYTPSLAAPIVANGVVYAACNGTNVCAWTLPSMIRWKR